MRNVVDDIIGEVFDRCALDRSGSPADYIPELAAVAPDSFALCLATSDGYIYEVGDAHTEFTIQSISKPLTYGLALADNGRAAVADKIDVEPSGEPFNEISLDPVTERPRNPMINAGAITSASLVAGDTVAERFERVRRTYSRYAGRELVIDDAVYRSEARTGHRNRAIGHMLRSFGIVESDPDDVVDLYFRQCSLKVTCRDLAVMASTMANNGVNPLTGERALAPDLLEHVLSVMTTCGMYDAAGEWVAEVGLPAKSGVGGGVLAVLPGQIGIAAYSPRLDAHGNSVRAVRACRELSKGLELHFLHVTRASRSAIRARHSVADVPSRKRRNEAELAVLREFGYLGQVFELHGDLLFSGAETAVREISALREQADAVIIDVRRTDDIGAVAQRMLADLRRGLLSSGCQAVLVDPDGLLGVTSSGVHAADARGRVFADLDAATQWVEDIVLQQHGAGEFASPAIELREHPLVAGLPAEQYERLQPDFEMRTYDRDEFLARRADPPAGLFLLLSGQVSTLLTGPDDVAHRITTLGPGMTFGEMPVLTGARFLIDVRADTRVRVAVLSAEHFQRLTEQYPLVKLTLLERLATGAYAQMEAAIRTGALQALR